MSAARLLLMAFLAGGSLLLAVAVFAANDGSPSPGPQTVGVVPQREEGQNDDQDSSGGQEGGSQQQEDENGDNEQDNGQEMGGPGRVTATNPDGVEVQLPCVSDVVRNPDRHPEWQVPSGQGCEPGRPNGTGNGNGNGPAGNGNGTRGGPERKAMTNPDGKCVQLPVVANVVRNRDRHPKWSGCAGTTEGGED